ncbi:hypothetical protein M0805_009746 [Coniferiporia weirii]|nr:hypothetical protein M0805_009746 [Coniferiporia weirii]
MSLDLSSNTATKLEPFLLMAKSARGAAAANLIRDAISAPGTFVFSELLEMPNIQELSKTEHSQFLSLLQLFAFGTFEDYCNSKDSLPPLNQAQLTKLKLLTIISYALERRILPYELLLRTLHIPTVRELEDLIIDGIYLDLIRGKLDQKRHQFEVEYTIGRDLGPGKLQDLLGALQEWANTTSSVLATLDDQLSQLASQNMAKKSMREEHERVVQATLADVHEKQKEKEGKGRSMFGSASNPSGGHEDPMAMDVDEPRLGIQTGTLSGMDTAKGRKLKLSPVDHNKPNARKRNRF